MSGQERPDPRRSGALDPVPAARGGGTRALPDSPDDWRGPHDDDLDGQARSARAVLPLNERTPVTVRRLVSTLLIAWGLSAQVELAELVASELASNAVRHAGDAGDLELELSVDEDVIRLCVADGSPLHPVLRRDTESRRSGLGLQLVDRVATRWGSEDYILGKRVWVELPVEPSPYPAPG
jgi:anti-sigma regulatory factor (Ser/Thr protein kinase)